jgi:hypothetical protein
MHISRNWARSGGDREAWRFATPEISMPRWKPVVRAAQGRGMTKRVLIDRDETVSIKSIGVEF